jgi:hypothetical protein
MTSSKKTYRILYTSILFALLITLPSLLFCQINLDCHSVIGSSPNRTDGVSTVSIDGMRNKTGTLKIFGPSSVADKQVIGDSKIVIPYLKSGNYKFKLLIDNSTEFYECSSNVEVIQNVISLSCNSITPNIRDQEIGELEISISGLNGRSGKLKLTGPTSKDPIAVDSDESYIVDGLKDGSYSAELSIEGEPGMSVECSSQIAVLEESVMMPCECIEVGIETDQCFLWSIEEGLQNPLSSKTQACPSSTTEYFLSIVDENGDVQDVINYLVEVESATIKSNSLPNLSCEDVTQINLFLENTYDTYEWSTDETSPSINVSASGEYRVTVSNSSPTCVIEASISISDDENDPCMHAFLEGKGFFSEICEVLSLPTPSIVNPNSSSDSKSRTGSTIIKHSPTFAEQVLELNIEELSQSLVQKLAAKNITADVYITNSNDICSGLFESTEQEFNSSISEYKIWYHVCDVANDRSDLLFTKM